MCDLQSARLQDTIFMVRHTDKITESVSRTGRLYFNLPQRRNRKLGDTDGHLPMLNFNPRLAKIQDFELPGGLYKWVLENFQ